MIDAKMRQAQALKLRLLGHSFEAISQSAWPLNDGGEAVACDGNGKLYGSRMAAHKAVNRELDRLKKEDAKVYEKIASIALREEKRLEFERQVELKRLQMLLRPVMLKAIFQGDIKANNMALKIINLRGMIIGYLPRRQHLKKKLARNEGIPGMLQRMKEIKAQREAALVTGS